MIKKLPASANEPDMQVIGAKINELIDKANELDTCIEKIIKILADITVFQMLGTFDSRFGVKKKDDK